MCRAGNGPLWVWILEEEVDRSCQYGWARILGGGRRKRRPLDGGFGRSLCSLQHQLEKRGQRNIFEMFSGRLLKTGMLMKERAPIEAI